MALTAAVTVAISAAGRLLPGRWVDLFAHLLAVLLAAGEVSWWVYAAVNRVPLSLGLPLQLSDVAPLVAAAALWWRWWWAAELAYFWGLAGVSLALLTPELPYAFPSFLFVQYVWVHGLTVLAAVFIPAALRLCPRAGAVARAALATAALAAAAAVADVATGGDYLFLAQPPVTPTPLSLLGPWPWYLAGAAAIALALLVLLDLPFRRRRQPESRIASG
ncbi:MAG: TIGR02206 family membrane protein [Candidatus Dormibacteraeota bacterium]|nr:TIGR02206 family membrane protein [Candidatus Dormibacteraeota bacterium]